MFLKIKTTLRRYLNKRLKFEHFSSAPFLSGDTFRSICNHVFDEFSDLTPADVEQGDIVFVKNNFLKEFFRDIHPRISNPYILLSHNDDTTIDESYTEYLDEKIIHWFGVNINVDHPKMTPLPIGLENINARKNGLLRYASHAQSDGMDRMAGKRGAAQSSDKRQPGILVAFNLKNTHPERITAFKELLTAPQASITEPLSDREVYIKALQSFSFAASPRGAGIDCHRTWEALYNGSIPVLLRSPNTDSFEKIGLPILLVDKWSDVKNISAEDLASRYDLLSKHMQHPALYLNFWIDKIDSKRLNLQ